MDSLLISFEGLQRSVIRETVKAELIQYTNGVQLTQNESATVPPAKPLTHHAIELLAAALQRQRKETKQRPYVGVFADWAVYEVSGSPAFRRHLLPVAFYLLPLMRLMLV